MNKADIAKASIRRGGDAAADITLENTAAGSSTAWSEAFVARAGDMVVLLEAGRIVYANQAWFDTFGLKSPKRLMGREVLEFVADSDRDIMRRLVDGALRRSKTRDVGFKRRNGGKLVCEVQALAVPVGETGQRLVALAARDVTHRRKAEQRLRAEHQALEAVIEQQAAALSTETEARKRAEESLRLAANVIDSLSEAVMIMDADFSVTAINPAYTAITGYAPEEILGRTAPFVSQFSRRRKIDREMRRELKRAGRWEGEYWNTRRNGEPYAEHLSISAILDEKDRVMDYAVVISDITKRKQDEERIRYQANYDPLTGLPNRQLFLERLGVCMRDLRGSKPKLGLMFLDLDGFKLVNDTLGHHVGDELLQQASQRLAEAVRNGDTVARLGGDEFTVIMPNLHDGRNAAKVAERIINLLEEPFILRGQEAFVSASIGITVFPDDAAELNDLIKNADSAMYRAKEQGKANYQFYTHDLNDEVRERLELRNGLVNALARGEFSLHYQPKLDLKTHRITGVEALMRWQSPTLGFVSPARFIPVMEETGMVVEVGAWAIQTALAQHKRWLKAGLPPVPIAVNLSARQLRDSGFAGVVNRFIREAKVKPEALEIEITESMLMSDAARTVVTLTELHDMGVRIAMDDFGTGYSSLSYLKKFPIDTIKIDRSFVADIAKDPDDAEIIRTIIGMGHALNRKIVAEGVEEQEQLAILQRYNCDELQGYYFSRPLPSDEATDFIAEYIRSGPEKT